jgi:hypothetical protein
VWAAGGVWAAGTGGGAAAVAVAWLVVSLLLPALLRPGPHRRVVLPDAASGPDQPGEQSGSAG